jgi:hypothetical protein
MILEQRSMRMKHFALASGIAVLGIPATSLSVTAPIYRSIHSPFPSGKMGVNQLLLQTEKAKEITWVQVSEFAGHTAKSAKGWLPRTNLLCSEDLESSAVDWGYGFTRSSAEVRETSQASGKLILLLPSETRLKITANVGSWAQVSLDNSRGYVPMGQLITKIDFEGNPSACFNSSMNSEMKKEPAFGSAIIQRIPFLAKVKRLQTMKTHWGYARLRDHGEVWWPMEKTKDGVPTTPPRKEQIPSGQLFQRQVQNMLQSPTDPNFWIASADGVYRSSDGNFWEKLQHFGADAPPIAFGPDGTLIVGTELSRNRGESFESFVRWEKALNEIYRQQGRHPEHIKVLSILTSPKKGNSKITLEVETGRNKKIIIETSDFGKNWRTTPSAMNTPPSLSEDDQEAP